MAAAALLTPMVAQSTTGSTPEPMEEATPYHWGTGYHGIGDENCDEDDCGSPAGWYESLHTAHSAEEVPRWAMSPAYGNRHICTHAPVGRHVSKGQVRPHVPDGESGGWVVVR